MKLDPVFIITCSLILSYIFVVASFHKWQNLEEFTETLRNYRLLPEASLGLFSYAIPGLELCCGLALLVPQSASVAAILAGALLLMYIFAIGLNLLKGRRSIDCGCGGVDQKQAISEWLIVRNSVLLFFSYCVIAATQAREALWLDWCIALLAAIVGCLFYNIVNQLLVNRDLLKGLRNHG
jgi:uncharacterized membrane protein YphA (DoxX/SURF4 family)